MAQTRKAQKPFLQAMQYVYGPFENLESSKLPTWNPPPLDGYNEGRYLWIDAFGVVNFLTLYKESKNDKYMLLADRLISTVHDVLAHQRESSVRLAGATDSKPLGGGLRCGSEIENKYWRDGDGQSFQDLAMWMFALNRMAIATKDNYYNAQAIELARAIHPRFVIPPSRSVKYPRLNAKLTEDLTTVIESRAQLNDPFLGFTIFKLLQRTSGDGRMLAKEIDDYQKVMAQKGDSYRSEDAFELGTTLWVSQWYKEKGNWADLLTKNGVRDITLTAYGGGRFQGYSSSRSGRLQMCLGIQCHKSDVMLRKLRENVLSAWESSKAVPLPRRDVSVEERTRAAQNLVTYCAAIYPGAFQRGYLCEE